MELIILLIIILVLFGSSRLPEISKGIGKAIGSLKKSYSENKETDTKTKKRSVSKRGKLG